jgi:hypothetical protein
LYTYIREFRSKVEEKEGKEEGKEKENIKAKYH